jgi:hypothetical protein
MIICLLLALLALSEGGRYSSAGRRSSSRRRSYVVALVSQAGHVSVNRTMWVIGQGRIRQPVRAGRPYVYEGQSSGGDGDASAEKARVADLGARRDLLQPGAAAAKALSRFAGTAGKWRGPNRHLWASRRFLSRPQQDWHLERADSASTPSVEVEGWSAEGSLSLRTPWFCWSASWPGWG